MMNRVEEVKRAAEQAGVPEVAMSGMLMAAAMGASNDTIINQGIIAVNRDSTAKAEAKSKILKMPSDYTYIQKEIAGMLTESTGIHSMDSAGKSGRHWQRNRLVKDFRNTQELYVSLYGDDGETPDIEVALNIFHFLDEFLVEDELSRKFNNELENLLEGASEIDAFYYFLDYIRTYGFECGDQWNTFNDESMLTQDIQGYFLENVEEPDLYEKYIVIKIHNGADIRGGYTSPRVFKVNDVEY